MIAGNRYLLHHNLGSLTYIEIKRLISCPVSNAFSARVWQGRLFSRLRAITGFTMLILKIKISASPYLSDARPLHEAGVLVLPDIPAQEARQGTH